MGQKKKQHREPRLYTMGDVGKLKSCVSQYQNRSKHCAREQCLKQRLLEGLKNSKIPADLEMNLILDIKLNFRYLSSNK